MYTALVFVLINAILVVDDLAEEALDGNQAMLDSIVTFHAISESYTQSSDGQNKLSAKNEQWKSGATTKSIELFTPLQGKGRRTIALSKDGLSHILYLPDYPLISQSQKMGHMLLPGNVYLQLGYAMPDDANKRFLTPSEMVQSGYAIVSTRVEGDMGNRIITIQFRHGYTIDIAERYNFLVTRLKEESADYTFTSQASDIRQVVPGVYVPYLIKREETLNGKISQRGETRVKAVEINRPIDAELFKLNMVAGGTMTDFTVGKGFFVDPEGNIIKENPAVKFSGTLHKPNVPVVLKTPVRTGGST